MKSTFSVFVFVLFVAFAPVLPAATFEILFPYPDTGHSYSEKNIHVSDDGSIVLAYSANTHETYLWELSKGITNHSAGYNGVTPHGMSGDGRTILSSTYPIAFFPIDASFDGTTIAGSRSKGDYRTVEAVGIVNGQFTGLGKLAADDTGSRAAAVSADGSTIVGASHAQNEHGVIYRMTPFRWTAETGMVSLGALPGATHAQANDVSGNGSVVVGRATINRTIEAFRWTEATGLQALGQLPGGRHVSDALAVSANGNVVVGYGRAESHLGGGVYDVLPEAFIWTQHGGMQELRDVLMNEYNVDLQNYRLRTATGVSANGNIIVGLGAGLGTTFVWRLNLIPEPTTAALMAIGFIATNPVRRRRPAC
jgi:uncharacterized membrane protein